MNALKRVVGVLALGFWFSSFFAWKYFDAHGLRTPDLQSGKTYPLDTHGSVVYLTPHEHYFLYGLIIAGIVFFLLSVVFYLSGASDHSLLPVDTMKKHHGANQQHFTLRQSMAHALP
jgi:hypothetical protein